MDQECAGSGRELADEPPPDRPVACPECGRAVKIDMAETDEGQRITIEHHQAVVAE